MLCSGAVNGWTAAALPSLDQDPQMTMGPSENAWMTGIIALGGIVGSLVAGRLVDLLGRRTSLLCMNPLLAMGWLTMALAPNLVMVLVGRAICGIITAFLFTAAPVYCSEAPEPWLRGRLGSMTTLFLTLGMLLSYVAGSLSSWRISCYICAVPCLLAFLAMWLVPESPYWFLLKNRKKEAEAALKWLRGPQIDLKKELQTIEEKVLEVGLKMEYKELLKPRTRKPFMIALFLMTLQQVSGGNILMMYTGNILISVGVTNHNMATIYVGLDQLAATILSVLLMDHVGRRPLIITSTLVMGLSTVMLGVYYYVSVVVGTTWPSWIPLLTMLVAVFGYCFGCRTIPWLTSAELFNTTIRSTANSVCFFYNRCLNFTVVQVYPFFSKAVGAHTTFFVHGGLSLLSCLIAFILLPETKGMSLEQIQDLFQNETNKHKTDIVIEHGDGRKGVVAAQDNDKGTKNLAATSASMNSMSVDASQVSLKLEHHPFL